MTIMDLNQLNYFVLSFRTQNFAQVADQLGIAVSSVSRGISALEKELGTTLFYRNTRTLEVTPAARSFLPCAEAALNTINRGVDAIAADQEQLCGSIKLNASVSFGTAVLSPIISSFSEAYPEIKIDLMLSDRVESPFHTQAHLSFRHNAQKDSALLSRKLMDVEYYLVGNAKVKTIDQLRESDIAALSYSGFADPLRIQDETDRCEMVSFRPRFLTSSPLALVQYLLSAKNNVFAVLPDWLVKVYLLNNSLHRAFPFSKIKVNDSETVISCVRIKDSYVAKRVQVFEAFLREALST